MPDKDPGPGAAGLLVAAPSSGAGKTTITLALLRALKKAGKKVASAKSGPDYIDPKFHEAASGHPCVNLDAWAMETATMKALAADQAAGQDLLVVEGAMGLFDGAANGSGSAAELAASLGLPVVLVVDCARQGQSVAALVHGFRSFRTDIRIKGIILNRIGSVRHETMLTEALRPLDVELLGAVPRSEDLLLPERHLGLVQALEHRNLDVFLERAAGLLSRHADLAAIERIAVEISYGNGTIPHLPEPFGQKIAIARDAAFAFAYPHLLSFWQGQGAELSFFSPLANEPPSQDADAVFLPGGYPELHAGILAAADRFKSGLHRAADAGTLIYGECGGYMTLGSGLMDADGESHEMLGLLPLKTSFQARKRHLGYRQVETLDGLPWAGKLTAHEFHYASIVHEGDAQRLFAASDSEGNRLKNMGLRNGNVMGSFAHVVSRSQTASSSTS